MLALLVKGGLLMIPIGLCSILAVVFSGERFWFLYLNHTPYNSFWETLQEPLSSGDLESAREQAAGYDGVLAELVEVGLSAEPVTIENVEESMKNAGNEIILSLRKFLPTIDFIAQVSPLLGLLGTVAGMIETFRVIAEAGIGNPNMLAGGIYKALITTAAGLTVGIVALFLHYLLKSKVDRMVNEMESGVRKTISLLEEADV